MAVRSHSIGKWRAAFSASVLMLCAVALAAPAALTVFPTTTAKNVLELISTRSDTRIHAAIISHFPYLQQVLANPKWEGTLFVPTDKAWLTANTTPTGFSLKGSTVAEGLAALARQVDFVTDVRAQEDNCLVFTWISVCAGLFTGKAIDINSVKNGTILKPVLATEFWAPLGEIDPTVLVQRNMKGSILNVTVSLVEIDDNGDYTDDYGGGRVLCSFKIGAAWLHLIDGVFVPEAAYEMYPQDNFEWLETYDGGIRAIFQASDYWDLVNPPAQSPDSPSIPVSPNEAYRPRVLTVLLPTEKALDAYLASKKTNLDTLLANKTAVNNFVEAHVVSGHRLRLMNLMDLALVYGSNEPVKGHYTSKCGPLVTIGGQKYDVSVSTNLLDVWVLPAGSSKIKAKVTTGITPAGVTWGCTDENCLDYTSTAMWLDAVMPH